MDNYNVIQNFHNTLKMMIFDKLKTNNVIIDTILTTLIISLFGTVLTFINKCDKSSLCKFIYNARYLYLYNVPNKIIISGKNCSAPSVYGDFYISAAYSDGFNALLDYIMKNIDKSNNVREIKELFSNSSNLNREQTITHFIVSQEKEFSIDKSKDIFFRILNIMEDREDGNKRTYKIENIIIELFSYKSSLQEIKQYLDDIVVNYKKSIQNDRVNKQFIYTVDKIELKEDESLYNVWNEEEFISNRTFENLFIDNKKDILQKIDFFIHNKNWYDDKGIPYNLGIGLHGPPGTGKTSFIKAIANKTKRDIIIIPLKMIKTTSQLKQVFYESTYNICNDKNSKSFDKKIIVFEDIDCIGDIIKNRGDKHIINHDNYYNIKNNITNDKTNDKTNEADKNNNKILTTLINQLDNNSVLIGPQLVYKDPVTLDDFLNLWDGVRETPGRIIVITSNHYKELDPALIRPGRIDLTYELKNVSHEILQEMHYHFFNKHISKKVIEQIQSEFYSPAEIVNIYLSNHLNEKAYLNRLLKNEKV